MNEFAVIRDKCEELEERLNHMDTTAVIDSVYNIESIDMAVSYSFKISQTAGLLTVMLMSADGQSQKITVTCNNNTVERSGVNSYLRIGEFARSDYEMNIVISTESLGGVNAIMTISAPRLQIFNILEG